MKKECKICSAELRVLKSLGIDPATNKEHGLVCATCWVDHGGVVGKVLEVPERTDWYKWSEPENIRIDWPSFTDSRLPNE